MINWLKSMKKYLFCSYLLLFHPKLFARQYLTSISLLECVKYIFWLSFISVILGYLSSSSAELTKANKEYCDYTLSLIETNYEYGFVQRVRSEAQLIDKNVKPSLVGVKYIGPMISSMDENMQIDLEKEKSITIGFTGLIFPYHCLLGNDVPQMALMSFGTASIMYKNVIPKNINIPIIPISILITMAIGFSLTISLLTSNLRDMTVNIDILKATLSFSILLYLLFSIATFASSYWGYSPTYISPIQYMFNKLIIAVIIISIGIIYASTLFIVILSDRVNLHWFKTIIVVITAIPLSTIFVPFFISKAVFAIIYSSEFISLLF